MIAFFTKPPLRSPRRGSGEHGSPDAWGIAWDDCISDGDCMDVDINDFLAFKEWVHIARRETRNWRIFMKPSPPGTSRRMQKTTALKVSSV